MLMLMVLFFLMPFKVYSDEPGSTSVDEVRVLIDVSGSMKHTDPKLLRMTALKLFVSILPSGTNAGVWTFGKWVNMLIKPTPVDAQWKNSARSASEMINSHGMFTNIEDALNKSTWDWSQPNPAHRRSLILLTDGLVDISNSSDENAASRKRIIEDILPRLQLADVKINTIALSDQSDADLLHLLSASTGGWFETVHSAEGLERIFLRLFEKVSSSNTIPIINNRVTVDGSISEASFLVFRDVNESETSITAPSGKVFSQDNHSNDIQWHKESRYDLITIYRPEPGDWQINAKLDPDNRVLVVTDLRLNHTLLPNEVLTNNSIPFQVMLEQKGNIIQHKEFLQFVHVRLQQTSMKGEKRYWWIYDNGKSPDIFANDGIYTAVIEGEFVPGEHEFEVSVDGTTFKRNSRQVIKAYDLPVEIGISLQNDGRTSISIVPYQSLIIEESMHITAIHTKPTGVQEELNIPIINAAEWGRLLDEKETPGNHSITFHITGNSPLGGIIDFVTAPIFFQITAIGNNNQQHIEETQTTESMTHAAPIGDLVQGVNWILVGLRVLILNTFIFVFAFVIYRFWPRIITHLIPSPVEEF